MPRMKGGTWQVPGLACQPTTSNEAPARTTRSSPTLMQLLAKTRRLPVF